MRVISARGLRAADFTLTRWRALTLESRVETRGTSDPYCVCELAGKAKKAFQTQAHFHLPKGSESGLG